MYYCCDGMLGLFSNFLWKLSNFGFWLKWLVICSYDILILRASIRVGNANYCTNIVVLTTWNLSVLWNNFVLHIFKRKWIFSCFSKFNKFHNDSEIVVFCTWLLRLKFWNSILIFCIVFLFLYLCIWIKCGIFMLKCWYFWNQILELFSF